MLTGAVLRVLFSVLSLQASYDCSMLAPTHLYATNLLFVPDFSHASTLFLLLLAASEPDDDPPLNQAFIDSIVTVSHAG